MGLVQQKPKTVTTVLKLLKTLKQLKFLPFMYYTVRERPVMSMDVITSLVVVEGTTAHVTPLSRHHRSSSASLVCHLWTTEKVWIQLLCQSWLSVKQQKELSNAPSVWNTYEKFPRVNRVNREFLNSSHTTRIRKKFS